MTVGDGINRHSIARKLAPALCAGAAVAALVHGLSAQPNAATQPAAIPPAATRPASAADTPVTKAVNPHWRSDGCTHCHEEAGGKYAPVPAEAIDHICFKCHDGRRAHQEVHPVGRGFTNDQVVRPEGWPLVNDRLVCSTCHDIRGLGHRPERPAANPAFLRGPIDRGLVAFCSTCHVRSPTHRRYNPHVMVDEQNRAIEARCGFCHESSMPAGTQAVRTGEARLKRDEMTICLSCHRSHVDYFDPGHIGARVPARIAENMRTSGHGRLPLAPDGRITCSTCHNPHQAGVFPPDSVLGAGGLRPGKPGLGLRGFDKELCSACHLQ